MTNAAGSNDDLVKPFPNDEPISEVKRLPGGCRQVANVSVEAVTLTMDLHE
jgi:hypothetical protein